MEDIDDRDSGDVVQVTGGSSDSAAGSDCPLIDVKYWNKEWRATINPKHVYEKTYHDCPEKFKLRLLHHCEGAGAISYSLKGGETGRLEKGESRYIDIEVPADKDATLGLGSGSSLPGATKITLTFTRRPGGDSDVG